MPLSDLRYLTVSFTDFSGQAQVGELIVAADLADEVVSIFAVLFAERFPIERMSLVDDYGGDDLTSMVDNNTSAFNCRFVDGSEKWSDHAFGRAIDINPLINPWVRAGSVSPVEGTPYADRTVARAGGIYDGSAVVAAFTDRGWTWGGNWESSKDYQHFSAD
ncbi:MAG: M15 family metallopeptidase [Acidimicrobiales bacterium]